MTIGCVIGLVAIFASSFMKNFWGFFFLYAGGFGVCNGISVRKIYLIYSISYRFIIAGGISLRAKGSWEV